MNQHGKGFSERLAICSIDVFIVLPFLLCSIMLSRI